MRVRRASDGFATVYDWKALAFVDPATATAPFVTMAPTDPTYEPGVYWHAFEPQSASNAVAPDIYRVTYYADDTLDMPLGSAEIRVGTVDTIDTTATTTSATLARTDVATSTRAAPGAAMTLAADAITSATIAAGAIGASEAPLLANLDAAVSSRATAAALATAQGNITTILGYGAPPSAAAVSAQVAADLAGAHGAGSWVTATGFATPGDVAASTAAIEAYGQAHWVTATGFATSGDVSAVPAAVWATAYGTPSANTFGWLTWRLAQWGTEIADKAIVGQLLVLRSLDLATTYASVTLRDKDGGLITPATGEPARFDP